MTIRGWSIVAGALLIAAGLALWFLVPAWDVALYRDLHLGASARTLPWLIRLTDIGGAAVMIPFALVIAAWLAMRRRYARAVWLAAAITGGRLIVELAKEICARDRPAIADRLVSVSSASFPSSHSASAMLTGLAVCVALRAGRAGWGAAAAFAFAIGVTRVALGVHWPSDVLAGWGFGLIWIAALIQLVPPDPPTSATNARDAAGDDQAARPLD